MQTQQFTLPNEWKPTWIFVLLLAVLLILMLTWSDWSKFNKETQPMADSLVLYRQHQQQANKNATFWKDSLTKLRNENIIDSIHYTTDTANYQQRASRF